MSSRRLLRVGAVVASGLLLLVAAAYLFGPHLVEQGLRDWAEEAGYQRVELASVRIDPILGQVVAEDLELTHGGEAVLEVGRLELDIDVIRLLRGGLHLELARLTGSRLHVDISETGDITIAGIALDDETQTVDLLHVVDTELTVTAPLFEASVIVDDLRYVDGSRVVADVIRLHDVQASIVRSDIERWEVTALGPSLSARFEAGPGADVPSGHLSEIEELAFQIDTIEVTGNSALHYQDHLFGADIEDRLIIDELKITGIDSEAPDRPVRFSMREHNAEDHGSRWEGEAYLFQDQISASLRGKIEFVNLDDISRITSRGLGIDIDSGSAAMELDITLQGEEISGAIALTTSGLTISAQQSPVLEVSHSRIEVSLTELLRGRLKIRSARLDGGRLVLEERADGSARLAGLVLADGDGQQGDADAAFPIDDMHVTNSEIDYIGPGLRLAAHVNDLRITGDALLAMDVVRLRGLNLLLAHRGPDDWKLSGDGRETAIDFGFGEAGFDDDSQTEFLPDVILRANRIELVDSSFRFEDYKLPYGHTLEVATATIEGIDSANPDSSASFVIELVSERHESVSLNGEARLFAEDPRIEIGGKIEAFGLPPLSTLTDAELGFVIKTGNLDGDIDLVVDGGSIDGVIDMRFNLLTVSTTDRKKLKPFEKNLHDHLWLTDIIYLLSDKRGVATVRVPITGDAHAPTFSFDVDMEAAVNKALTSAVGLAIIPVVSILSAIFKRPRMAKIEFAAGSDDLSEKAQGQIAKAAAKLIETDRLATVCGVYTADEMADQTDSKSSGREQAMLALSERRTGNVRTILIETHGLPTTQLIACAPKKTTLRTPLVELR